MAETPVVAATPDKDTSRELLSEKLEDDEPDGIFTFKRKPHVKYHHVSGCILGVGGGVGALNVEALSILGRDFRDWGPVPRA